ncbi:MAG TPA: response regulator [Opitutaceae bacterium]|jgi:CheY-like chemotaxis protein|nr:response regulator [Opitutaceae bacterium]
MSLNILIVDDCASVRLYHIRLLSRKGYHCTGVASAEEALAVLPSGNIDLILLDMMMPGMSGEAFVEFLSRKPTHVGVPVLIITSDEASALVSLALASNPISVLVKPVMPAALLDRVQLMLNVTAPAGPTA